MKEKIIINSIKFSLLFNSGFGHFFSVRVRKKEIIKANLYFEEYLSFNHSRQVNAKLSYLVLNIIFNLSNIAN